jgi:hypothetical protein
MAEQKRISHEEFARRAIQTLRTEKSKGIHVVYSQFNAAWKEYFGTNPKDGVMALTKTGKFVSHPCKGGAMLYLAGEAPPAGQKALTAILAE